MNQVNWADYKPRAERIASELEALIDHRAARKDDELIRALQEYERLIRRTNRYPIEESADDRGESVGDIANRTAPPTLPLPTAVRRPNVGALRTTLRSTLETLSSIENYGVKEAIEGLLGGDPEGLLTRGQLKKLQDQQELACMLVVREQQRHSKENVPEGKVWECDYVAKVVCDRNRLAAQIDDWATGRKD